MVKEAQVIEGSAVPMGSNEYTPTQEVKEPSQDTQKQEPSQDTRIDYSKLETLKKMGKELNEQEKAFLETVKEEQKKDR